MGSFMGLRILHLRRGTVSLKQDSENQEEITLTLLITLPQLGGGETPQLRHAGAAVGAALQILLQPGQCRPGRNGRADLRFAHLEAGADGFLEGGGAGSDVLSHETLLQMQARRPGVEVLELPGIGHAPALMSQDQIAAVREFLLR